MASARHVAVHALAAARRRRPPFALSYHGLGHESASDDPHGLMTTPEAFAAQVDSLVARGYRLVGVTELWDAVQRGPAAAEGLGAITFDDGLADSMHTAAEILGARRAVATAFLSPGLFGQDHPDLPPGRRILDADEVAALERSGLEIGGHSYDHIRLPELTAAEQLDQLRRSRAALEALVGHPVTTMAYPFGAYDAVTLRAAADAGFTVACANGGAGPWRALELPREPVFPSTSVRRLTVKAAGLYGPAQVISELRGRARGHCP